VLLKAADMRRLYYETAVDLAVLYGNLLEARARDRPPSIRKG